MGSEGRRSSAYKTVATEFKTGKYVCHLCGEAPGLTVDHDPPLSAFPHWRMWSGRLLPACKSCQDRQGGQIRAEQSGHRPRPRSRVW